MRIIKYTFMSQHRVSPHTRLAVALTSAAIVASGCSSNNKEPASAALPTARHEQPTTAYSCAPDSRTVSVQLAPIDDFLGHNGSEALTRQWDGLQHTAEQLLRQSGVPHEAQVKMHAMVGNMVLDSELKNAGQLLDLAGRSPGGQFMDSKVYHFIMGETVDPAVTPLEPSAGALILEPLIPAPC